MGRRIIFILSFVFKVLLLDAQIGVDKTLKYLITKYDNQPLLWIADTGWELFYRLTHEEAAIVHSLLPIQIKEIGC